MNTRRFRQRRRDATSATLIRTGEPTLAALRNPLLRYFLATRPAFLTVTVDACFIGLASAYASGVVLRPAASGSRALRSVFGLVAIGADYVQRGSLAQLPVIAAAPYALLVTNILYINQFPDRAADEASGKRHWVVRLGAQKARWGYAAIGGCAYLWLGAAVAARSLPGPALLALMAAAPSALATRDLWRFASEPRHLAPAIRSTILAALLHSVLIAGALVFAP